MKIARNWIAAALLVLAWGAVCAARAEESKSVLFLNSYHNGYAWSDNILRGLRNVLDHSGMKIDLQIEYMDTKKYPYSEMAPRLRELYARKHAGEKFDVAVVSDNNALQFVVDYGRELFPGVPVVFGGVNYFDLTKLEGRGITGVIESIDARKIFELAIKLHPKVRKVLVIGDDSSTGVAIRHQVEDAVPYFQGRLRFEFVDRFDLREMLETSARLGDDTMVYFIPLFQSIRGRFYTAEELLRIIQRNNPKVPFYSNWRYLLGHGTVGGNLILGSAHGRAVGEVALRILSGEKVKDIPIDHQVREQNVFDYQIVEALGLDWKLLPKGSTFINEPKAFYELGKEVFWTIIVSMVLLVLVLALLARNIVRRRAVEQEIKEQLSFLELLLDTIPMLICWKDRGLRYLGVNSSFCSFYGASGPQEMLGLTHQELPMDREFKSRVSDLDLEVLATGQQVMKRKVAAEDAMNQQVWLEITKVPLRNEKDEVVGILTISENITREVSLERQLLQSQKMEAIGTLAGGLAHDFNNILTSIINSAELVLGGLDQDSQDYKDLERVLRAAYRGSEVVKRILAFSRPSREGMTDTRIADTVNEALNLVERSVPRNIELRRRIEASDVVICADPTQIHQVVMNLCTNAYQALKETGGAIEVSLAQDVVDTDLAQILNVAPGNYLKLTVADNGPGIDEDIRDKVFDPFFTTKEPGEGTGLGLAVVHGILVSHQGVVRLTSLPGEQTRFEIFLPVRERGEGCHSREQGAVHRGKENLLFIEDEEDQIVTIPRVLEGLGYRVTACKEPERALRLVEEDTGAFDLVITDFDMPGINGLELARRLAVIRPDLPIVMVSGRKGFLDEAAQCRNISSVVMKPYNRTTISEAIRSALV